MQFLYKSVLVGAALCSVAFTSAKAEVFQLSDTEGQFSLTVPDTWSQANNQKADDRITVEGPGANDYAVCRVRVRNDERFKIFPQQYDSAVQRAGYSRKFWDLYLGEYEDVRIDAFKDEAGVGKAFASMAEVSYTTVDGTPVHKRGVMFGGLYEGGAYVVECSAEQSLYQKWRLEFLSIIKSVDMIKKDHEFRNGDYRKFNEDLDVNIHGPKVQDIYTF